MSEARSNLQRHIDECGTIPLAWVASTPEVPDANLGDALSPIIVSAMTGLPVKHCGFDADCERLVAVGTIGQAQRNGHVHFWGTGLDDGLFQPNAAKYSRPPATAFEVHAMRGPYSANALRRAGQHAPEIYGDPVWFLPKLVDSRQVEKRYDLGVVVHISELERKSAHAPIKELIERYKIPPALRQSIRIINTYARPSARALFDKTMEILSCRRIASTSFHGLVIAEAFGIPCLWFAKYPGGRVTVDIHDEKVRIDHRVRDFYAGAGTRDFSYYALPPKHAPEWPGLMDAIDALWKPLNYDSRSLFDAFPLRKSVTLEQVSWPLDWCILDAMRF